MPNYTNLEYVKTSKNTILADLNDSLRQQHASNVEQNLIELYNNEVELKLQKMSERNPQIAEFLNEFYSSSNYDMSKFDPKQIKDKENQPKLSQNELEVIFEKYDQIFDKNTSQEKIANVVTNRFLELNSELNSKIEYNAIQNKTQSNLDKNLSENIAMRINMSIDAKGEHEIDKFAKFLNVSHEFKGDENMALFQTLKMMDKALMDENNKDFKAKYEKIGLSFTDINGKQIQINARLGEGHFQKDLDHLIKIGCNDCNIGTASKIANKFFIKSTELKEPVKEEQKELGQEQAKSKGLEFKNPATLDNFEKCLKGGVEATAALAESIGDESVTAFTQNLSRVASISGLGKHISSAISSQNDRSESKEVLEGLGNAYEKKVKSGAIKLPKEKVMEHSNQKSLGASR